MSNERPLDLGVPLVPSPVAGTLKGAAIRHMIFDLDGTLFDTAPDIAAALAAAVGRPMDEQLLKVVRCGLPLQEMIRSAVGQNAPIETVERIASDFRRRYDACDFAGTHAYPGIPELLKRLKNAGLLLHIATNKRERPTLSILQRKGVRDLFSQIVCVDSDGAKRTKRQMLERILATAHATPSSAVFAGDSVADVAAGREAGIRTVGVLYGYGERQAMLAAGSDVICERVEELLVSVSCVG